MTTVRELITRMGFKTDTASLNRVEQSVERVKDGADRAAKALQIMAAAVAAFAGARAVVAIADEMQNLRSRIGMLPQTIGDAGAAFDVLVDHASNAGMAIDAYAGLYSRVGMAARDYIKTQQDLLGITDTIGKALTVGGASTQDAAAVMQQFGQALASGVLQGDEFRSMAEAAPQYLDQLSIAMNIPRENLKKMASEGKLTAKEVIEATRKMSGYFDGQFRKMPMTMGRAMTMVGNKWRQLIDKMNRESGFITTMANMVIDGLGKIEGGIEKLVKVLGGAENALRLFTIAFGVAFGAGAVALIRAFGLATLKWLAPWAAIALAIGVVSLALEDLYVWVKGGDSLIGRSIGSWADFKKTMQGAWDAVKGLASILTLIVTPILLAWTASKMLTAAMAIYRGVVVAVTVVQAALNAVMLMNPMGLFLIAITALIAGGVLLMANWQTVKDWFSSFFDWFGQKISWFADKLSILGGLGALGGIVPGAGLIGMVMPSQMSSQGQGKAGATVNNTTTVNMTVPQGTPKEQQSAIKRTADAAFSRPYSGAMARDIAARGR